MVLGGRPGGSMNLLFAWVRLLVELNLTRLSETYPLRAAAVTVTGHATAFTDGAWVEIIPANVVNKHYVVNSITISSIVGVHEISIGEGAAAAEVERGRLRVVANGTYPFPCARISMNGRLAMRTASVAGTSQTFAVVVNYSKLV